MDPNGNSILYIYLVNPSQAAAEAAAVRYFGHDKLRSIREIRPLQAQFTLKQLREWYDKDLIEARPLSLPEVTLTDLDEGKNRIEVGVGCERDRDRVREELQKRLTSLGIPLEAVIFTVRGRAYSLIMPPVFESTRLDKIKNLHSLESIDTEDSDTRGRSGWVHSSRGGALRQSRALQQPAGEGGAVGTGVARNCRRSAIMGHI